jgi:hypothetical protein
MDPYLQGAYSQNVIRYFVIKYFFENWYSPNNLKKNFREYFVIKNLTKCLSYYLKNFCKNLERVL